MGKYSLIISKIADDDISVIYNNILFLTGEPKAAKRITDQIFEKIEQLTFFPKCILLMNNRRLQVQDSDFLM